MLRLYCCLLIFVYYHLLLKRLNQQEHCFAQLLCVFFAVVCLALPYGARTESLVVLFVVSREVLQERVIRMAIAISLTLLFFPIWLTLALVHRSKHRVVEEHFLFSDGMTFKIGVHPQDTWTQDNTRQPISYMNAVCSCICFASCSRLYCRQFSIQSNLLIPAHTFHSSEDYQTLVLWLSCVRNART